MCVYVCEYIYICFTSGTVVKSLATAKDSGDKRFDPWVKKSSWRKKRQPTPVFLPGKFRSQSMGSQRVRLSMHTLPMYINTYLYVYFNRRIEEKGGAGTH